LTNDLLGLLHDGLQVAKVVVRDRPPVIAGVPRCRRQKKTGVVEHPQVFDHAGLLIDGPPGMAGLPFV